jgi:hypothetical protein
MLSIFSRVLPSEIDFDTIANTAVPELILPVLAPSFVNNFTEIQKRLVLDQ